MSAQPWPANDALRSIRAVWHSKTRPHKESGELRHALAQRGMVVSYEAIRHWWGTSSARSMLHAAATTCRMGDTWYLDELFVTIQGQRQYVWRADTHTLLSHRSESCRGGVAPRVSWVPGLEVDAMFGNYGQTDEPVRVTT
jgi:hypothetical protein